MYRGKGTFNGERRQARPLDHHSNNMSYLVVEFKDGIEVVEMRAAVAGLVNPE